MEGEEDARVKDTDGRMSVAEDDRNNQDDRDGEGVEGSERGLGLAATSGTSAEATARDSSLVNFHRDIDRWKNLYEACQAKLESLRAIEAQVEASAGLDEEACRDELRAEVRAATATLEQEHGLVERALEQHGAVLAGLLRRLHARDVTSSSRLRPQPSDVPLPNSAEASAAPVQQAAGSAEQEPAVISKETIGLLKDLIREHELLSAAVEEARAKQRAKDPLIKECHSVSAMRAAEDKLRRTSGLLELQVKRLQYELSRLTQAQATEMAAVAKLQQQAESELRLTLAREEALERTREHTHHQLLDGARGARPAAAPGQEMYRHGSRGSFVDSLEHLQRRKERRLRLEGRLYSDRVYREVDQLDDQADVLRRLDEKLTTEIEEMSEMGRSLETTWHSLRQERDELTAHLYPDQQQLQELQDIAKEKLELETKLHKEHFLFKRQVEDFQKEKLEVETDLLTGNINKKARATKNIVTQLETLRDCIAEQNDELWRELRERHLSISRTDSLASAAVGEEEFRQHITDKMKKMELLIKEDLDRRALFKSKKFVFEPPGPSACKVPFRGQRNVIKVPSKLAADWRRKTTVEMHRQAEMDRQVEKLRRDILNKLAQEKKKAKQQLLQYESQRVAAGAAGAATSEDMKASQELRSILAQLDAFLQRSRKGKEREASSFKLERAVPEDEEDDFGREMRMLVIQLEKLQTALEGSTEREREHKATALERGRELFNQLPDAEPSPEDAAR